MRRLSASCWANASAWSSLIAPGSIRHPGAGDAAQASISARYGVAAPSATSARSAAEVTPRPVSHQRSCHASKQSGRLLQHPEQFVVARARPSPVRLFEVTEVPVRPRWQKAGRSRSATSIWPSSSK